MESVRAVKALPSDLNNQLVPDAKLTYVLRDRAGPVWLRRPAPRDGRNHRQEHLRVLRTRCSPSRLRRWSASSIRSCRSGFADRSRRPCPTCWRGTPRSWDRRPACKPTIMLSWVGPTPRLTSRAGSVLPGLIVLTYEGAGRPLGRRGRPHRGLQFIAHEAAHFWLGQTVAYEYARDAWITEGGADLLAMRLMALEHPRYDWRDDFNHSIAECANLTRRRGVESARERNENRAYYACGAVFGLIAESASGRSFFTFRENTRRRQPRRRDREPRRMAGGARCGQPETGTEPRHRAAARRGSGRSAGIHRIAVRSAPALRTASMLRECRNCPDGQVSPTENCAPLPPRSASRWQILPMHSRCKSCLYCGLVNYMTVGDPPPVTKWKRPVLLVAGIALTVCTVLALRFAWERTDGTFFATVAASSTSSRCSAS